MKKQKKLKLGKIKIAGINNTHRIIGGLETVNPTCQTNEVHTCVCAYSDNCATNGCATNGCDTDLQTTCGTTQHTRSESNDCGAGEPSQVGEIC